MNSSAAEKLADKISEFSAKLSIKLKNQLERRESSPVLTTESIIAESNGNIMYIKIQERRYSKISRRSFKINKQSLIRLGKIWKIAKQCELDHITTVDVNAGIVAEEDYIQADKSSKLSKSDFLNDMFCLLARYNALEGD